MFIKLPRRLLQIVQRLCLSANTQVGICVRQFLNFDPHPIDDNYEIMREFTTAYSIHQHTLHA